MAFRQEFQLALGAVVQPLAQQPSGAQGGGGLDDVPASAQRVFFRVEQSQNALLLVGLQLANQSAGAIATTASEP